MAIFKILVVGALGYAAYKALQNHQNNQQLQSVADTGRTTPPHGDKIAQRDTWGEEPEPVHADAQFSRGFGEA
jgi:uncharacterized membrane protein YebE (DUF533 family)